MGDSISESSSSWTRDEFEYVDEVRMGKKESSKDSINSPNNEEAVSAAVSLVVGSLRHGVVSLCASVAHILREKALLQQQIADLEKHRLNLENNVSGTASVNGSCSVHCQSSNLHSLQESLVTQRCDSAPASFIASGLKFLKSDYQRNVSSAQTDGLRHCEGNNDCHVVHEQGKGECRTSSISMPEAHSSLVPKLINDDKKASFSRSSVQPSTRSLNVCQSLPASSFVRRKYSTISLRRVRRSTTNRQKASSICSSSSFNSYMSLTNSEDHRRSSNNSSCIITVAEIHTPPGQHVVPENREGDAVKLLARTLTTVLQSDIDQEASCNESEVDEVKSSSSSKSNDNKELCLPHPLAGCECFICLHLTADPTCQLYALTTEGGSLLPPGSTVLVEGERVGTVLYLGHEKLITLNQNYVSPISVDALLSQEGYMRPVGLTLKLWAPDYGELFVPLSAVICQLDENLDLPRKESWSSFEYEYVGEDSDEELHSGPEINVYNKDRISSELCVQSDEPQDASPKVKNMATRNEEPPYDPYISRSPSVSSCCSVISHSLGDLSVCGLECEDVEFGKDGTFCIDDGTLSDRVHFTEDQGTKSIREKYSNAKEISFQERALNTTFTKNDNEEGSNESQGFQGSLYDTCDSAISLSFTRRLQYSEDNSGPSSVTDTGRESPQFGDTWDSGCSVGRRRCRSGSSGHSSDSESENHRLGSTYARSLGDALNFVLEKHNIQQNWDFENDISNEGNTGMYVNTDLSKDYEGSKERLQEFQDFFKNTSLSSSTYHISESFPEQSEV